MLPRSDGLSNGSSSDISRRLERMVKYFLTCPVNSSQALAARSQHKLRLLIQFHVGALNCCNKAHRHFSL